MAFANVQFPTNISRGARGGPRRKTQVATVASGAEERNASWFASRHSYDIGFAIRKADFLATVIAFFEARNGMLFAFRFKDWADYKSCMPSATPSATDQPLGEGDGTEDEFQLIKRYSSGGVNYDREITKPIEATVLVAINGTPTINFTVDPLTGIVTFEDPPADDAVLTAGFEFDVPVRFDTDQIDGTVDFERSGAISSIPLIEVRE